MWQRNEEKKKKKNIDKKTATLELSPPFGNVDFVMSSFGVIRGVIRLNLNTEH